MDYKTRHLKKQVLSKHGPMYVDTSTLELNTLTHTHSERNTLTQLNDSIPSFFLYEYYYINV